MTTIFNHRSPEFIRKWQKNGKNRYNGAYYYSVEITERIIPNVETDRNWILLNVPGMCADHSIVFIHNNLQPSRYDWLKDYDDLVLVCGVESTARKVAHLGKTIFLPLSVNVEEVKAYSTEKTKDLCFAGRKNKAFGIPAFPLCDYIHSMPREDLLPSLAAYKRCYAVGRCAIEAKILGCDILPYDRRFPDPNIWQVLDNLEAAQILREKLDEVDG